MLRGEVVSLGGGKGRDVWCSACDGTACSVDLQLLPINPNLPRTNFSSAILLFFAFLLLIA
jgi:hypothetical protein